MEETDPAGSPPGAMIRQWRKLRKLSQASLAELAGISTRHLSFMETGRSRPGPRSLLRLGQALQLSFRQQNALFRACGYGPHFPEPVLEAPVMIPVWDVISQLLNQHEPFPALVAGPGYDIIWSNHGFQKLVGFLAGKSILERFRNVYRLVFAEDGLRPFFPGWEVLKEELLARLKREIETSLDPGLWILYEELSAQAQTGEPIAGAGINAAYGAAPAESAVMSFSVKKDTLLLTFIPTLTTFHMASSVTAEEMRILSFFPADGETRELYIARFASGKQ